MHLFVTSIWRDWTCLLRCGMSSCLELGSSICQDKLTPFSINKEDNQRNSIGFGQFKDNDKDELVLPNVEGRTACTSYELSIINS